MNLIKNSIKKTALSACMLFLSVNLFAAEAPQIPWRDIKLASNPLMFYVLTILAIVLLILIIVFAGMVNTMLASVSFKSKKEGSGKAAPIVIFALLMMSGFSAFAQTAAAPVAEQFIVMSSGVFWVMVGVNIFLFIVLLSILRLISSLKKSMLGMEVVESAASKEDIWTGALNAAVPIEREAEILMDHDYDGIKELDNNLPPWWIYGFYLTIIIAVGYLSYYHVFKKGDLQAAEYEKEMAEGQKLKEAYLANSAAVVDENTVVAFADAVNIDKGKVTFNTYCVPCHGPQGGGVVGPNLTDDYWIHGGGIKNIFKTIKYGVPAKGMITWENTLSATKIQEVASFILTLKGTNPANPKEPQGTIWTEGATQAKPDSTVADSITAVAAIKK